MFHTPRLLNTITEMNRMIMLPVNYGYARVRKSDDDAKNLGTQLLLLGNYGIHEDLIFTDVASGRTMNRPGWRACCPTSNPATPSLSHS